ncbi:NAD-dependent succinate-semialdehyde dehydrogenase [Actinoallomurus vinaceus]|uniref:NAD-dependent succinate-semialdehyde dehydrogenase n=1 Tax=Actinoallomurus vinaceus TaxID=1080074 RepID=UPI0031EACFBB
MNTFDVHDALYIDGQWVRDAVGGGRFDVTDPATGDVLASLPDGGRAEMSRAIAAAASAQSAWADTPAPVRGKILAAAGRLMLERIDLLAHLMTREQGKPLRESRTEIRYAASFLSWFAGEAERIYGRQIPSADPTKRLLVLKRPVGITAGVTPWNFPAAMITRKLGPALAAGCTMVVKPSELTPLSALEIARVFADAGLPTGVFSVVAGLDAADIVEPVMADMRVRKLSFTGSTTVGTALMAQAASTMKRLSLELGGHAPFLVFEDADLDIAVDAAVASKMRNMGQTCVAANRFYVHRAVVDRFAERLAQRLGELVVGNGLDDRTDVGPLISEPAVAKVEAHVADAIANGADLLTGGSRTVAGGPFFAPTVLRGVDPTMRISREETFGPVVAISTFESEQEAVALANSTPYGLAAYYFTRDVGRVLRLAERLEFGVIGANDGIPSTAQAPFGGIKASGIGHEGGAEGIAEYLDVKYLSIGSIEAAVD